MPARPPPAHPAGARCAPHSLVPASRARSCRSSWSRHAPASFRAHACSQGQPPRRPSPAKGRRRRPPRHHPRSTQPPPQCHAAQPTSRRPPSVRGWLVSPWRQTALRRRCRPRRPARRQVGAAALWRKAGREACVHAQPSAGHALAVASLSSPPWSRLTLPTCLMLLPTEAYAACIAQFVRKHEKAAAAAAAAAGADAEEANGAAAGVRVWDGGMTGLRGGGKQGRLVWAYSLVSARTSLQHRL